MANDEDKTEKIRAIVSDDSLGYAGMGREEHSGENSPEPIEELEDELADNRPEDVTSS
ncbi:MAG TPA: hypothetical protein VKU62_05995 [Thermoanaerobaculia bacterium]|nr:hypothetical protein [Thermoanaerobaculia bacterium]